MDLDALLGPSVFLKILDLFLEHPDEHMNMRAISRRIKKNPGSVHPILPKLVEKQILNAIQVSAVSYVYSLNKESDYVQILLEFFARLNEQKDAIEIEV